MVPSLGLLLNAALRIIDCSEVAIDRLCVDQDVSAVRIVDIALLPQWQGRGIGSRLLAPGRQPGLSLQPERRAGQPGPAAVSAPELSGLWRCPAVYPDAAAGRHARPVAEGRPQPMRCEHPGHKPADP